MFVKVTNPTGDDLEYAQTFLKTWKPGDKLDRPNMELLADVDEVIPVWRS
jgi:hypothetical protein